jgi:hypothetical protein
VITSERSTWWVSFVILGSIGVLWSLSTAPVGAPDEPAHAVKAVAIARGQFTTDFELSGTPDTLRTPITDVRVPQAYASLNGLGKCWVTKLEVPVSCAPPLSNDENEVESYTYVGAYPPLYYTVVGWPSRLLTPRTAFYAMRVVTALICAALLASGFSSAVSLTSRPALLAGCALAITPMALFLAGSINPNAVEIAAAFCLWVSALAVLAQPDATSTRLLVRVTVAGLLAASTRILSPAFVVVILSVLLLANGRQALASLWSDRRVRAATAVLAAGVIASVAFLVLNHSFDDRFRFARPENLTRGDVARLSFENTGRHLEQAVGTLGWIGFGRIRLPSGLIDGWIAAVSGLGLLALAVGRWRERLALAAVTVGSLALPIVTETLTLREFGWQGRYGLPLAMGIPVLAGWIVGRSERLPRAVERSLVMVVGVGAAIAYVVAHQTMMTRNTVGLPNGLFEGLGRGVWDGPLTPLTLLVFAVVVSLSYAVWLAMLASRTTTAEYGRRPRHAGARA